IGEPAEPFGVLGVHTTRARSFSPHEIYFVQTVANVLADAVRRVRDEAALREREERYRTTLMSVGDAVIATDGQGRVVAMNPVAETLTGWTQAEARGLPLDTVFPIVNEESRQPVESPLGRVLREGKVVGLANHTLLIARDGTERPIADSGAPIFNDQGEITGVVLVFRDQTEQRRAEREREYLASFPAMNPQPVLEASMDGRVLYANRAAHRVVEELGLPGPEALLPADVRAALTDALHHGGAPSRLELAAGPRVFEATLFSRGEAAAVRFYLHDITERKRAETALRESEARYRALFEHMTSGVAVYQAVDEGRDFVFLDMNRAGLEMAGLTREEVIGRRLTEVFPGVREMNLLGVLCRVWQTGVSEHYPATRYADARLDSWYENRVYRLPSGEV
ncbi:MAG: PAS domain S-box protein, partial [Armatimonadota bacterium]|nr:PAS domain S-box protein [Armatimonadota bacterium]